MAWNRADINDVKQSLDCGTDALAISISTRYSREYKLQKTRDWVLDSMAKQ